MPDGTQVAFTVKIRTVFRVVTTTTGLDSDRDPPARPDTHPLRLLSMQSHRPVTGLALNVEQTIIDGRIQKSAGLTKAGSVASKTA